MSKRQRDDNSTTTATYVWGVALLGFLSALQGLILLLFTREAPQIYMDELFHERQTRMYCQGRWDIWDEKITTFPGLYLAATAWVKLIHATIGILGVATTEGDVFREGDANFLLKLRLLNSVFNVASFCLIYRIYRYKKLSASSAAVHSLSLLLYPVIFFFGFLYYTDAGSLLLVLAMYDLAQRHRHLAAALAGSCSVIFRQTNAVWIAFVLGTCIVRDMAQSQAKDKHDDKRPGWADADPGEDLSLRLLGRFAGRILYSWRRLLGLFWPYLLPLGAFAAFVVANGGSIVVGDRNNHKMTVHVAQLAYFFALAAAFHSPTSLVTSLPQFVSWLTRLGPIKVLIGGGLAALLLDRYTLSHPFLLADNRHYTFYLWQRVFQRIPHANVWFLPIYAISAWWTLSRMSTHLSSPLPAVILVVALCLTLLPAHLIEPRYFTTPLVLTVLELPSPRPLPSLLVTGLASLLVNAIIIYIFLYKPFTWNDGSTARFMW